MMFDTFKELCLLAGVSGNEQPVSDYIVKKLAGMDGVDYTIDPLGSILVHKKGADRAKTRLMLSAHMDEVGLIVTYVDESGLLKFGPVGGIDPRVVVGRRVRLAKSGVTGVIGTKAIHLQKADERKEAPDFDKLLIDIGASSREQALQWVEPGDTAVFDSEFIRFGDGFVKSKAIDDRAGCAILLEILSSPLPYDIDIAFNVQEEIGTRGARAAAFSLDPQVSIVVEATTAADVANVPEDKRVCYLGGGPVISFMDHATVYDRELYKLAFDTAAQEGIACQTKTAVAGGNDSGAIHLSRGGVRPLAVSIPCRYLHSPSCVINYADAEGTSALVAALCKIIPSKPTC